VHAGVPQVNSERLRCLDLPLYQTTSARPLAQACLKLSGCNSASGANKKQRSTSPCRACTSRCFPGSFFKAAYAVKLMHVLANGKTSAGGRILEQIWRQAVRHPAELQHRSALRCNGSWQVLSLHEINTCCAVRSTQCQHCKVVTRALERVALLLAGTAAHCGAFRAMLSAHAKLEHLQLQGHANDWKQYAGVQRWATSPTALQLPRHLPCDPTLLIWHSSDAAAADFAASTLQTQQVWSTPRNPPGQCSGN
jgi:hypothetical protein